MSGPRIVCTDSGPRTVCADNGPRTVCADSGPRTVGGDSGSKAVYMSHQLNFIIYRTIDVMRDLPGYTFVRLPPPR